MELKVKLHADIKALENELEIKQDEKAYNDRSDYYLLNRLAELRVIKMQREIIKQGKEIMSLNTKRDTPEMKREIENIKDKIRQEEENNKDYEFQYENFANIYLGMDNNLKGEMIKILNECLTLGIPVSEELINQTDSYMFNNYALTEEKLKKSTSDSDGGRGLGMGLSLENEAESDM